MFKNVIKITLSIIISIILSVLCTLFLFHVPSIQKVVAKKVTSSLNNKFHADFDVGYIRIGLRRILVDHVSISIKKDTLVKTGQICILFNPSKLFNQHLSISLVSLTKVAFHFKSDSAGNTNLDFLLSKDEKDDVEKKPSSWKISLEEFYLLNSKFRYDNPHRNLELTTGNFSISFLAENDFFNSRFLISTIEIDNTHILINTISEVSEPSPSPKNGNSEKKMPFFVLERLNINNVSFRLTDRNGSEKFAHIGSAFIIPWKINIDQRHLIIKELDINHGVVSLIDNSRETLSTREKNISDSSLSWTIAIEKGQIRLDTIIKQDIIRNWNLPYISDLRLTQVILDFNGNFKNVNNWQGTIALLKFRDEKINQNTLLYSSASSDNGRIDIDSFFLSTGSTYLQGFGSLNNSAVANTIPEFKINFTNSTIKKKDIIYYFPVSLNKIAEKIPDSILLNVLINSLKDEVQGKGSFLTNAGDITFYVKVDQVNSLKNSDYVVNVHLNDLDARFFLKNPMIGDITMNMNVTGKGISKEPVLSELNMNIQSILFKGLQYQDIHINGNLIRDSVFVEVQSNDPKIILSTTVKGRINEPREFHLISVMDQLDLHSMGLIKDTMILSARLNAFYSIDSLKQMSLISDTLNITFYKPGEKIVTSNQLKYIEKKDAVSAFVGSSAFGTFSYTGNLNVSQLTTAMKEYFGQYNMHRNNLPPADETSFFQVELAVNDLTLLNEFMPMQISIPDKGTLTGELKNNKFSSRINFNKIIYGKYEFDSLIVEMNGRDSGFKVDLFLAAFQNSFYPVRDVHIEGNMNNEDVDARIAFSNLEGEKWFDISGALKPWNTGYTLHLQDPLLLHHQRWDVNSDNRIFFADRRIQFSDFNMNREEDKEISLLSNQDDKNQFTLLLKNLDLSLISELLRGDTTSLNGNMNGNVAVVNVFSNPALDADLNITNLISGEHQLGDLSLLASNIKDPKLINVDFKLGEELSLRGYYDLKSTHPLHFTFLANNLDVSNFATFLDKVVEEPKGFLNVSLNINGAVKSPSLDGKIGFHQMNIFLKPLHTSFGLNDQQVLFEGDRLVFPEFTVKDAEKGSLVIDGDVSYRDFKNIDYNLKINSDKFLAYSPGDESPATKGNKIIFTSEINLVGQNAMPQLKADLQIEEDSRFFYKMVKRRTTLSESGVVEFINTEQDDTIIVPQKFSIMQNLDLAANLSIPPNTSVSIITDPVKNIGLNLKAGGLLSVMQRPFQSPRLTGKLLVTEGDYTLSFTGIERKFQIKDSSSLTWYGEISNPELNLKAFYQVRVSPAELMGSNTAEFAGTLPFMVNLLITGKLEAPVLNFYLSLPPEYQNVNNGLIAAKLQEVNANESDRNQKAMTLLLFGSFGFSNIAGVFARQGRTNAMISNALNQFAAQKVTFADLHFDLQSYDNYGGATGENLRTELEFNASKKYFDKRLNAQLGATFIIQGDEQEQRKPFFYRTIPEFKFNYLLNKPRTLSVKTFRDSEYRGLIEGKVVSTGVGIMYQKDFDHLNELFTNSNAQK